MKIQKMKIKDYEKIIAVWQAAGLHMDPVSDSQAMMGLTLTISPESCFVALDKGRIVGAVIGAFNGRRVWIYHLGVLPEYQGKHIGKKLMLAVEKASVSAGSPKLSLAVTWDNLQVAGFYKKLGFYPVDDCVWYSKKIGGKYE